MILSAGYQVERLAAKHDLSAFQCKEPGASRLLADSGSRLPRKACLYRAPAIDRYSSALLGFFTLSNFAIYRNALSRTEAKKHPFDPIPAILLGQLARDSDRAPTGFGATILIEAWREAIKNDGWALLITDPLSRESQAWFSHLGFREVAQRYPATDEEQGDKPIQLFMRRKEIEAWLDSE